MLFTGDSDRSKIDDQFAVGEQFTVHYDPANPQTSVIDPTFPTVRATFALLALTVIMPFLWFVSRLFRQIGRIFRIDGR
jgi:hypothetical protein